ncbi:hypothetical protein [Raoultella sp. HC6]|uniref:hypothetical protein n=1 Tax=Raoultella sp. HC6 TaxID=2923366 RepID=UPI001F50DAEC|nr:hypothetical protein [Raoultella sp. HC6]
MNRRQIIFFFCIFCTSGCYYKTSQVPAVDKAFLNNYPSVIDAHGTIKDKEFTAAWRDFLEASARCRVIHNNYEIKSNNAEQTKLLLGTTGGIAGITGSTLIAAGSSTVVGGIAAGMAGVISMVLGNSEKGPLSTTYFVKQKESIAHQIQQAADSAKSAKEPKDVYMIASNLSASCLAAESLEGEK